MLKLRPVALPPARAGKTSWDCCSPEVPSRRSPSTSDGVAEPRERDNQEQLYVWLRLGSRTEATALLTDRLLVATRASSGARLRTSGLNRSFNPLARLAIQHAAPRSVDTPYGTA